MVGTSSRIMTFLKSFGRSKEMSHLEMLHEKKLVSLLKSWRIVKSVSPGDLMVPVHDGLSQHDNFIEYLKSQHMVTCIYWGKVGGTAIEDIIVEAIILDDCIFGYFPEEMSNTISILIAPSPVLPYSSELTLPIEQIMLLNGFVKLLDEIQNGEHEDVTIESSLLNDIYNIIIWEQKQFRINLGLPP